MTARKLTLLITLAAMLPGALGAMDIHEFKRMADKDQNEYIADVIEGAEKVLRDEGRADTADQVSQLFKTNAPDLDVSIGVLEFERTLWAPEPGMKISQVEDAMVIALSKHGIALPPAFMTVNNDFKRQLPLGEEDTRPFDWDGMIASWKKEYAAKKNAVPARPPTRLLGSVRTPVPSPEPPPAAPPPPVIPAPVDDPIGAGGFITPPAGYGKKLTARLIFGDAVRFEGSQWRFENGTALPAQLIDSKAGRPPLLPKQQYSPKQAPVSGYIQAIKNVLASVQACKEYTDSAKTQFVYSVESSGFDLDDYGVMASRTVASVPSSTAKIGYAQGAALANLDLEHASFVDHGCMLLVIQCKNGSSCIRSQAAQVGSSTGDLAQSWLTLEINTREQGAKILDALSALAPFYPTGDGEVHEIP